MLSQVSRQTYIKLVLINFISIFNAQTHPIPFTNATIIRELLSSDIPVVRGEVGHGYHRLFFPHFFLTTCSIKGLQLLHSFTLVRHSPPAVLASTFSNLYTEV